MCPAIKGPELLRKFRKWTADATLWLLAAALLLWCGDWAVWHLRVRRGTAYSSVQVTQLLLTPLKNHRIKAEEQGTLNQSCVRALFPHDGEDPCWWLRRHATQSQSASRMGAAETRAVSAAIYHLVISNSDMYRFNCLRPH